MTSLVLRTAGSVVGGAFLGPVGAAIGGALGASAGYRIDQHLFGAGPQNREGPRLADLEVQTSTEGAPIARAYGRARLNGQVIWATNYTERVTKREQRTGAAKGGGAGSRSTQTTYSYYANFAVGLCEGEIAYVGRIWANGAELDLQDVTYRVYRGTEDQQPDSLIAAKQGEDNSPSYKGLAYVVFEDLPLESYGNRLPQLSFEVVRSVGALEQQVRSMVMIPGATEFGYDTTEVVREIGIGEWSNENRHTTEPGTDFEVSLNHLLALCPNLQRIALVISWFGTDLRADACQIRPGVDDRTKVTEGDEWSVAGVTRQDAYEVSRTDDRPAYGGTPTDESVKRAIKAIRDRGLEVALYPFVMMDIPSNNELPDPYSEGYQAAFPWRGRITCFPGPGQANSADKTSNADQQVGQFYRTQEWSYRRFILHYADLAMAAGGVDFFLLGSEFRGLTWLRNQQLDYPFVHALKDLAHDVRSVVGARCKISYGADWSEYFGHQPPNEGGYVRYHLDALWSDDNIDAIGIDNYMPLSDWRSGDRHLDATRADTGFDIDYLQSNIAAGEGYDWYYASEEDRAREVRSAITDGTAGKAWVYRYKDLVNWWQNAHFDRTNGQEATVSTDWVPQSKPIWFTELGCPAVHLGANEPNRFPDPKSAESGSPYHSTGTRDDGAQRAMLEASLAYWDAQIGAKNPISNLYNGPMVDPDQIYLWAWDARPFPVFPLDNEAWSDGGSWNTGHWLTGRLGSGPIGGIVEAIFSDFSLPKPLIECSLPVVDGFVIDRPMSARAAMEGMSDLFGLNIRLKGDQLAIGQIQKRTDLHLSNDAIAESDESPLMSKQVEAWEGEAASISVVFKEIFQDYRQSVARFVQPAARTQKEVNQSIAAIATQPVMVEYAKNWLRGKNYGRHTIHFALPPSFLSLDAGDVVELDENGTIQRYHISEIEDGTVRQVQATLLAPRNPAPILGHSRSGRSRSHSSMRPTLEVLDLPLLPGRADKPHAPYLAAFAKPWLGSVSLYEGAPNSGFSLRQSLDVPSIMGHLISDLPGAQAFLWDRASVFDVKLYDGALASVTNRAVLTGANAAAVRSLNGDWEILQFEQAHLIGENSWRLFGLLRGQLGTEIAAQYGASEGARFVLLDEAVVALEASENDLNKSMSYRIVPAGSVVNDPNNSNKSITLSGEGLKPLSPVHLRVERNGSGDIAFRWIRRGRIEADSWAGSSIPLDEDMEQYLLRIYRDAAGSLIRQEHVDAPEWTYTEAARQADGVAAQDVLRIEVQQISRLFGPGATMARNISLASLSITDIAVA